MKYHKEHGSTFQTIIVMGNSGSGKSTLAKALSQQRRLAHLDLDTVAWQPSSPPSRMPLAESVASIAQFTAQNPAWVMEGCYSDLVETQLAHCDLLIYLGLSATDCVANAKNRPWEPHKYESKAAQDANLPMLIDWIQAYDTRTDTFSRAAHTDLYQSFTGQKQQFDSTDEINLFLTSF